MCIRTFGEAKARLVFHHYMEEQGAGGVGRLFCKSALPPGSSIGVHKHTGEHEIYFILSGKGCANDNGTWVEVGPGDVQHCLDGQEQPREHR